METEDEYLDRICGITQKKVKKVRTKKAKISGDFKILPGYTWDDIQTMQRGTYQRRLIK